MYSWWVCGGEKSSVSSSSSTLLEKPFTVFFVSMISREEPVRATGRDLSAASMLRTGASERVHAQECVRGYQLLLPRSEAGSSPSWHHSLQVCLPSSGKGSLYPVESRAGAKRWSWHPVRAGCARGGPGNHEGPRQFSACGLPAVRRSKQACVRAIEEQCRFLTALPYVRPLVSSWLRGIVSPGLGPRAGWPPMWLKTLASQGRSLSPWYPLLFCVPFCGFRCRPFPFLLFLSEFLWVFFVSSAA